jgi:tRNA(adenine34) deaminase
MAQNKSDTFFMKRALELANQAAQSGEVPIGCVIVSKEGEILGEGLNQPIALNDPTAHAEIRAIRQACSTIYNYRLDKSMTAYVTLQPCIMCAGAFLQTRIGRLVIAALDSRLHSIHHFVNLYSGQFGNHTIITEQGCCETEAREILYTFFQDRRS